MTMARVDVVDVQEILETTLDADVIAAFIDSASAWIDLNLSGTCAGLSEQGLEKIELHLAAHLCTSRDRQLAQARRGDISETYVGAKDHSQYLETAAAFDPCGIVRQQFMGKGRAMFSVADGYA
jgi:hypothetical protein